jgi:ribosomal protein S18 acetylase RimI-like enzyme
VETFFSSSNSFEQGATGRSSAASTVAVRSAQSKDLSDLADVLTDSFHPPSGIVRWVSPLLRLGIYEDLRNRLRSTAPNYACLVAVDGPARNIDAYDYLIGTIEVTLRTTHLWQSRQAQHPYLSNLAVREEFRRRGVAQQLLTSCERIVLDWGFEDIYLHVLENNHAAKRLYFKAGYRLQQTELDWSCWLLGRPRRLFLHKRLT